MITVDAGGYAWSGPEPEAPEGYQLQLMAWDLADKHGDGAFDTTRPHIEKVRELVRFARRCASSQEAARVMLRTLRGFERDGEPVTRQLWDAATLTERQGFFFAMAHVWMRLGFFDLGPADKIAEQVSRTLPADPTPEP